MKFELESEHIIALERLAKSGMTPVVIAKRAKILLMKADGKSCSEIAEALEISRHTAELWVKKYNKREKDEPIKEILSVDEGRGRKDEISGEAKTWLLSIACTKPKELGLSAETWTTSSLTKYINKQAIEAGYERLASVTESGIYKILDKSNIKPFRIKYYCERKDPEFDTKMHNVLVCYKQLEMQFDENGNLLPFEEDEEVVHILSYDEKPGIQAIANIAEDKMPTEQNGVIMRDYEYKRLGTVSLLAGIDLQTGEAIPLVRDTHNSNDYIDFLKILDDKYPKNDKIRIILDNLKVHKSDKVQQYLETIPNRFEFVFTPKHASWLNLVEGFFSKMTKQMLRGIRVESKDELVHRIYKYFDEVNEVPVVYRWEWNLNDIKPNEELQVECFKKSS